MKTAKKTAPKTKKPAPKTKKPAPKTKKPAPKKVAPKKAAKPAAQKSAALHDFVAAAIDADKAQDIVTIPLKGKTTIADFMVIATGTSSRHVSSMARKLCDRLKAERGISPRAEGLESGDWVIVDAGDVMVHLFRQEVRAFYDLEKLWGADFETVNYTRYQV